MFSIFNKFEYGFHKVILGQHNQFIVELVPACGAMLHAFKVKLPNGWINLIDSYPDKATFDGYAEVNGFKGLKLSPFPCRTKNSRFIFDNNEFVLGSYNNSGDALHGFLYNSVFNVVKEHTDETSATVTIEYQYAGDIPGYPFPYKCNIIYTITTANRLSIITEITNTGDSIQPVADGWHPYFCFNKPVNELLLSFKATQKLEFENLVPTGKILHDDRFSTGMMIGDTELDNSFFLDFTKENPMCTLQDPSIGEISFYPDVSYPYLQIYIPPHRKSIAIENISAAPDALNNKFSLTVLKPGEVKQFKTAYAFRAFK